MKKTPSHFMACVEIEQQISFFSFGFARVSKVRHIYHCNIKQFSFLFLNSSYFQKYNPEVTYCINVFKKVKYFSNFCHEKEIKYFNIFLLS